MSDPATPQDRERMRVASEQRRRRVDIERERAPKVFARLPQTEAFSGLRRTQIMAAVARGEFPAPVSLTATGRAIAWDLAELEKWRADRLAARDTACSEPQPPSPPLPRRGRELLATAGSSPANATTALLRRKAVGR